MLAGGVNRWSKVFIVESGESRMKMQADGSEDGEIDRTYIT